MSGGDGADDFQSVLQKVAALFLAGADDRLGVGESFCAPVGAIHSAVGAGGSHAADVSFSRRFWMRFTWALVLGAVAKSPKRS